jgi:F0F1-type ATP synthase assembly protein I
MMDSSRGAERAKERRETGIGMRMAGLGFQTSSEVAAGALLGYLFDWWRGQGTIGLVVGGVLGIVVGMTSLLRGAMRMNREFDAAGRPEDKKDA